MGRGETPNVPGLHIIGQPPLEPRRPIEHLDASPLPEGAVLAPYDPDDENIWVPVQSRRGCAMRCSYCKSSTL